MSRNPSGEEMAGTIIMAVIVLTIVITIAIAAALAAGAKEIGTVYAEHAHEDSPYRRVLLIALGALGVIGTMLLILALVVPSASVGCMVTFAWALLGFVVTVEVTDGVGRRHLKDGGNVASYLDFSSDTPVGDRERVALP